MLHDRPLYERAAVHILFFIPTVSTA